MLYLSLPPLSFLTLSKSNNMCRFQQYLNFSSVCLYRRKCERVPSPVMWRRVVWWKFTEVSERKCLRFQYRKVNQKKQKTKISPNFHETTRRHIRENPTFSTCGCGTAPYLRRCAPGHLMITCQLHDEWSLRPGGTGLCPVSASSGSNHAHHDGMAKAVDAAGLNHEHLMLSQPSLPRESAASNWEMLRLSQLPLWRVLAHSSTLKMGTAGSSETFVKNSPDYTESHRWRQFIFEHFQDFVCNNDCCKCFSVTSKELHGAEFLLRSW